MARNAILLVLSLTLPSAAQSPPRFHLPATPFDYTAIQTPAGLPLPLPRRNDGAPAAVVNARATLGRVLFYDPLLSRNWTRSCSSCHQQAHAFADGSAASLGFAGQRTRRNSMSLVNLAFHDGHLFWDARAASLEAAVLLPIQNGVEMGMDLDDLVVRLAAQPDYAPLFSAAFGTAEVRTERIATALAAFVRAIVSLQSRYDEGLAAAGKDGVDADFANFTPPENRGKRLFFGTPQTRARSCAACHVQSRGWGANFIDPVSFDSEECTNNGVDGGRRGDDPGFGGVHHDDRDRGKFRAPSLRNIGLTAPYMHDGRFKTLADVLKFYANRVHPHPNLDSALRPPTVADFASIVGPTLGFPLSQVDRNDLLAFLETLTDRSILVDPRLGDPFKPVP
jgi:cytochrome c peroxidase